ncbi:hypothetical protein D3C80_1314920 [compost metagenome]
MVLLEMILINKLRMLSVFCVEVKICKEIIGIIVKWTACYDCYKKAQILSLFRVRKIKVITNFRKK